MDKGQYVKLTVAIIITGMCFMIYFGVFNNIIVLKWDPTLIKLKLDTETFHSCTGLNCTNFFKSYFWKKTYKSVVYLGDSCMYHLFMAILGKTRSCKVRKQASRCSLISYFGQQKLYNWTKPSSIEGPVWYGLTHPFCTDCSKCNSALFHCGETKIEYISVEYARDVEIQSTIGNTTQEAVSLYLNSSFTNVCVVNSGIHDMMLPALTDQLYVQNVQFYVQHLVHTCQNVIWISTTAVRGDKIFPQNNRRIQLWNRLIKGMIRDKFPKLYWEKKRTCKVRKQAYRCNLISYLGQQKRSNWTKPSSTEGPVGYGLTHPFCTDCSGCNSALFNCGEIKMEYISVEYARDVEIQSTIGNTTQEAVSLYFNSNFTNVCVVNSGFHDMVLPALTDQLYVKNVQFYVQHLVQRVRM
ncbi:unnamed protein product [Mytilus edulis]|uniref:Uncharacterized protein n=1 Tax=Mytilus edulis TaxID=6550 RepID=A0A8S3REU7_MYTED|nr:unnamed protein product [Mytilus edulis]